MDSKYVNLREQSVLCVEAFRHRHNGCLVEMLWRYIRRMWRSINSDCYHLQQFGAACEYGMSTFVSPNGKMARKWRMKSAVCLRDIAGALGMNP